MVDYAVLHGRIHTVFGWNCHVTADTKPRSLRNYPMQSNGNEILRLACCLATERGIEICCPIHDALLVQGKAFEIEEIVEATQMAMREASQAVLGGFPLRSEATIVKFPERYSDPRGEWTWNQIIRLLERYEDPS